MTIRIAGRERSAAVHGRPARSGKRAGRARAPARVAPGVHRQHCAQQTL